MGPIEEGHTGGVQVIDNDLDPLPAKFFLLASRKSLRAPGFHARLVSELRLDATKTQIRKDLMKSHWCLEAGFAWSNSVDTVGPFSFRYISDYGIECTCTVDEAWYGHSHEWTPDAKDWM